MEDKLIIRGARENNLKNINIDIPKNKLVIMTGLSGSGKTSLADVYKRQVTQFAQLYNKHPGYASIMNVMGVIFSIITMPFIIMIYQLL